MRIFQIIIDVLVFVSMIALMYSGIIISRYAFVFLQISGGMSLARRLHILGSYWGFLLMNIHLGLCIFASHYLSKLLKNARGRKEII